MGGGARYLAADCVPVSEMAQTGHLRSAVGHQLVVPSYRLDSCGFRAFSVLGPRLCVTPTTTQLALDILLRYSFSQSISAWSALGALAIIRYTNLRLLT